MEPRNAHLDMEALTRLVPVKITKVGAAQVPTCKARELHAYLEVRRDFSSWIKGRIGKYGFTEGSDFVVEAAIVSAGDCSPNLVSKHRGGRNALEYHLTLDMAKELAMVENNAMGRQVRRYFIECERRAAGAVQHAVCQPSPQDQAWAEWLSLSTDERRTRQKDILIGCRLYGSAGGRYNAYQLGHPQPPKWVLTSSQQHELDLARQSGSVSVSVVFPNGGSQH